MTSLTPIVPAMPEPCVFVVHGPQSWPLATRLALDLVSEGIEAAPMSLEEFRAPGRDVLLASARALVIMYDWWLEPPDLDALERAKARYSVVFARNGQRKVAPEIAHFLNVGLFDGNTFSYYQPFEGTGGYRQLIEYLDLPSDAQTDRRRRGFAFVSYVSKDRTTVYGQVIPALWACRTGYFDYRYTERLNEARLDEELARTIKSCEVVVAFASRDWRTFENPHIRKEFDLARELARPIVAVTASADGDESDASMIGCRFGPDRVENAQALETAIREALDGRARAAVR